MSHRLLGLLAFTVLFTASLSSPVLAVDPLDLACSTAPTTSSACNRGDATNPDPIGGTTGIIQRIAKLIAGITGIASVILIIIGTIKYITSGGDQNSVSSAKHTIVYALVGLVVALMAQVIIIFVINKVK